MSDLRNYLQSEYGDHLIEGSAAKNAIRLLKMAKKRGFNPAKRQDRNNLEENTDVGSS